MSRIKLIALDVLKPHLPDAVEFCSHLAAIGADYRVELEVVEVDEHTQTILLTVQGDNLDMPRIEDAIQELGGSIHSMDRVIVCGAERG
jgi:hypothetical protein